MASAEAGSAGESYVSASRGKNEVCLTDATKHAPVLVHVNLVEERDERLVSCLEQQELEVIAVEGDTLERREDGMEKGTTRD